MWPGDGIDLARSVRRHPVRFEIGGLARERDATIVAGVVAFIGAVFVARFLPNEIRFGSAIPEHAHGDTAASRTPGPLSTPRPFRTPEPPGSPPPFSIRR